MKLLLKLAFILSSVLVAQAIRCWTCQDARSNQECNKKGQWTDCQVNQEVCETEVRWARMSGERITKRCKQKHACDNNQYQNDKDAWSPTQCNKRRYSSVCRCCCIDPEICKESTDCKRQRQEDPCTPISLNPNVEMICINKYEIVDKKEDMPFGTVCNFWCNKKGLEVSGFKRTICMHRGSKNSNATYFNHQSPICKNTTCGNLDALKDGTTTCTNGNRDKSVCSFRCNIGFALEGRRTTQCNGDTNTWTNPVPECKPAYCSPEQTNPLDGAVSCTNGFSLNSRCSFTCNSNFFLDGATSVTCNTNANSNTGGTWSGPAPVCIPDCIPPAVAPRNGGVSCSRGAEVGSRCTYTCHNGYYNAPNFRTQTCQKDRDGGRSSQWIPSKPAGEICQPILCPVISNPPNGNVNCNNGLRIGSECAYSCDSGYYLVGVGYGASNDKATCLTSVTSNVDGKGKWSPSPLPTCRPILCRATRNPINGNVNCNNGRRIGSECTYSCNSGYYLVGNGFGASNDKATCGETRTSNVDGDGVWSPSPEPTCEPILCPATSNPVNGNVNCNKVRRIVGSECTYSCDSGYYLVGNGFGASNDKATCGETRTSNVDGDGVWSPSPEPTCRAITCPTLSNILNGRTSCNGNRVNDKCTYACNPGHYLSGTGFGSLNDEPFNDETTCETTSTSNSNGSGTWNPSPQPTCPPIKCPKLSAPSNGQISCVGDGEDIGNDCAYICDSDFYLNGTGFGPSNDKTTCETNLTSSLTGIGVWSPSPPATCSQITCPTLNNPPNGQIQCTGVNPGNDCSYTCNTGYFLAGANFGLTNDKTTCETTSTSSSDGIGRWNPTPPPVCTSITCPTLENPSNGRVSCSNGDNIASECTFTCNANYYLAGSGFGVNNRKTTCVSTRLLGGNLIGSWNPSPPPRCLPITCPPVTTIQNGQRSCEGNRVGNECTYTCNNGYYLTGTGFGPSNSKITCGTTATSDADGNGIWSPSPPPSCLPITCDRPNNPENGGISCSGTSINDTCDYTCTTGFYLVGTRPPRRASTNTIICQQSSNSSSDGKGVWNPEPLPTCRPIVCIKPATLRNTQLACTDEYNFGSNCTYSCNSGYKPKGYKSNETVESQKCVGPVNRFTGKGTWLNRKFLICEIISCTALTTIQNGEVLCATYHVNDTCQYQCQPGFSLVLGPEKKTCQLRPTKNDPYNAEWTSDVNPTCSKPCEPEFKSQQLNTTYNAEISCSNESELDSTCTFTCASGFITQQGGTTQETTCQNVGATDPEWNPGSINILPCSESI